MLFVNYPKCSTCKKAEKWLKDHGLEYESRNIKEENPTEEELREWIRRSGLPVYYFPLLFSDLFRLSGFSIPAECFTGNWG